MAAAGSIETTDVPHQADRLQRVSSWRPVIWTDGMDRHGDKPLVTTLQQSG